VTLDVRVRLAEGAGAVAGQPQPIQDWYYAEDGLRLDALDSDIAALAAAAVTSEEAVRVQREALDALAAGWHGGSGSNAVDFVSRHCETAGSVVAALRDGAAELNALSEKLGHVVDAKVGTALRGDWVLSRSPDDSTMAYDTAVTRLGELPVPRFETPLAPTRPTFDPMAPDPSRPAPASPSMPPQQAVPGWNPGSPSVGLPNFGGSLAGLINQIAQALGSYSDITPSDAPQSDAPPGPTKDSVADVKPVVQEEQSAAEAPLAAEAPPAAEVTAPAVDAAQPPPTPATLPTPPTPAAEPAAVDDTATPCEIAADELPQVGQ